MHVPSYFSHIVAKQQSSDKMTYDLSPLYDVSLTFSCNCSMTLLFSKDFFVVFLSLLPSPLPDLPAQSAKISPKVPGEPSQDPLIIRG